MHFVGIDLAWGERNPTGVAVLDDSGRLMKVASVTADAEIVDALAPYGRSRVVVAIDAPLVVTNPTGSRPAEQALSKDFRRFDAGTHPSNTGKAEFRDGPRGARVATALRLSLDPGSRARRRAIEVYPHAATVALFGLSRVLRYKNKRGRTLPGMRAELLRLTALLEGLADAPTPLHLDVPDWQALVASVEAAERKSDLRRAEDQVDAVVCAYVALFATRQPADVTTYGDAATGAIITPTLPADPLPPPAPRADAVGATGSGAALSTAAEVATVAATAYAERHGSLVAAGEVFARLVTDVVDEAGINYLTIEGRTKSVTSFAEKAARTLEGEPLYPDPLRDITDQIGLRVIAYLQSDVSAVVDALADHFEVHGDRDMGQETASEGRFGYASRHLLISLDDVAAQVPEAAAARGLSAQVQIRTVLQHAWAQFEHEVRYKGTVPAEHAPDLDRRFTLAAGLLELADSEFSAIRERLQAGGGSPADEGVSDDPRISGRDMAAFLAGQYAEAGWSRTDHYAWISGLALELGITSLTELAGVLREVDEAAIQERMAYKYPPGAVRRLDDALLWVYGDRYVGLHGNAHRAEALRGRLTRMRSTD